MTHLRMIVMGVIALGVWTGAVALGDEPRSKTRPDAEAVRIPISPGHELAGFVHRPIKGNAVAAVLAPGSAGVDESVLRKVADGLAEVGFLAIRFDWAFITAQGEPSKGLSAERAELDAVIKWGRTQGGIKKIVLVGKSFGSRLVLARADRSGDDLAGIALLNLPIHSENPPEGVVEEAELLMTQTVPSVVIAAERCSRGDLKLLYVLGRNSNIVAVPGDELFQEGASNDVRTSANIDLVARAVAAWLRRFTGT